MPQQKIVILNAKASADSTASPNLEEINTHLGEGYFVKSWLVTPNHVNEFVTITVLLEKLESKAAPGVKFGLEPRS
jgi:hypothetical protein